MSDSRSVHLKLGPHTMERLETLKLRTDAGSYNEVVKASLRVYEVWLREHELADLPDEQ